MLAGHIALVVEEEFLIALETQRILETLGVRQTLFARTPDEAEQLRRRWPEIAVAIVEVRSDNAGSLALAANLAIAGIPTVLTTADAGYSDASGAPLVVKPVPEADLVEAIRQALAHRLE